jgi:hypothetical protein
VRSEEPVSSTRSRTEEHRRSDLLVCELLGPPAKKLQLLPFVGRLDPPTPRSAHPCSPHIWCCESGRMPRLEVCCHSDAIRLRRPSSLPAWRHAYAGQLMARSAPVPKITLQDVGYFSWWAGYRPYLAGRSQNFEGLGNSLGSLGSSCVHNLQQPQGYTRTCTCSGLKSLLRS